MARNKQPRARARALSDHHQGPVAPMTPVEASLESIVPGPANWKLACDALAEAAIVMDERGEIKHANRAASELLAREQHVLIGQTCSELFHGSCNPPPECPHRRFQKTGVSQRGDLATSQGNAFNIALAPIPVSPGSGAGCIATLRSLAAKPPDELARREAQQQLASRVRSLEQRIRHLTLLGEMEEVAQTCHSSRELYPLLARFAETLFCEDSGLLRILDAKSGTAETVARWGPQYESKVLIRVADCVALRTGRVCDSSFSEERCRHVNDASEWGTFCVPVLTPYDTIGTLEIHSHDLLREPQALENGLRHRAITTGQHLGRAISSVRLRETLRLESIRDPLTGLFNRRYMEEALDRELHRAARANSQLSLIMLDVDRFKRFNDSHGHAAGDSLLRGLSQLLQSRTRHEDIACRYGGEEFLLILPETSVEVAQRRAEYLREQSRALKVSPITDHEEITLSLGVSAFPRDGSTVQELLKSVDRRLYRAKNSGRDRVVAAGADDLAGVSVVGSE